MAKTTEEQLQELAAQVHIMSSTVEILKQMVIDINKHMVDSFNKVDGNFDIMNARLDRLTTFSTEGFQNVTHNLNEVGDDLKEKVALLHEEVRKIEKVSNYSAEYENLLKIIN